MTVLLEVRDVRGRIRRCDGVCHRGRRSRAKKCGCVCEGQFHGVDVEALSWEELNEARAALPLRDGETVQLRIGA